MAKTTLDAILEFVPIATLPMVWVAWRRDHILIAAIPHVLANTLGGLGVLWLAFS